VRDSVPHDVGRMHVREFVHDLTSAAAGPDQARATQDPQMLTDEGLRRTDRIDEFVDAVRVIGQQVDDREADGGGQRTEQVSRCVVPL
jgi:hypothetical protein